MHALIATMFLSEERFPHARVRAELVLPLLAPGVCTEVVCHSPYTQAVRRPHSHLFCGRRRCRIDIRFNSSKYQLESIRREKAYIRREDGIRRGIREFKGKDKFEFPPSTALLELGKIESYLNLALKRRVVACELHSRQLPSIPNLQRSSDRSRPTRSRC